MDVKAIRETTIRDLESIILGIRNIEFNEELSYSFNTQEIQNAQFVENLLDEIRKPMKTEYS
jgi:ethanolamine utilization cobalamin adenosyltransferase